MIVLLPFTALSVGAVDSSVNLQTYYAAADGKADYALRAALNGIISPHTTVSYDDLRHLFKYSDTYNAEGLVIEDIYSYCDPAYTTQFCLGDCGYNREHSLPKSWWKTVEDARYSDAFHLYPTNCYVNSDRGNYAFGECANGSPCSTNGISAKGRRGKSTFVAENGKSYVSDETVYEPDDAYKGDLARSYFYMVTCYINSNYSQADGGQLMFVYVNNIADLSQYSIDLLLKWHRQDPVSQKELIRNEVIYGNPLYNKGDHAQYNRNPFIDYPCLAEYIWGEHKGEAIDLSQLISAYDPAYTGDGCSGGSVLPPCTPEVITASFAYDSIGVPVCNGYVDNPLTTNATTTVIYTSDDPNIAEVNNTTGEVTIKGIGTTTISASIPATKCTTEASASYKLTTFRTKPEFTIGNATLELNKDEQGEVWFFYTYYGSQPGTFTYRSDHPEIASVAPDGYVTGVSAGTARITVYVSETACETADSIFCDITVYDFHSLPATDITTTSFTANWTPEKSGEYALYVFRETTQETTEERDTVFLYESFTNGQGTFIAHNINLSGLDHVWEAIPSGQYTGYLKATGYVNGTNYATESWLLSPEIDLADATSAKLTFSSAAKFQNGVLSDEVTLWVAEEPNSAFDADEWTQIPIPNYPTAGTWTYVSSGDIDISAYKDKKIQIAFRYLSTSAAADTYQIRYFRVSGRYSHAISETNYEQIDGSPLNGLTDTQAVITDLEAATTYVYVVALPNGIYSAPIEVTTSEAPDDPATSLDPTPALPQARKVLINGHLYILHNGKTYTLQGAQIR